MTPDPWPTPAPSSASERPDAPSAGDGGSAAHLPPRDPVWRGIDVALVLILTGLAMVIALLVGVIILATAHRGNLAAIHPLTDIRFLLSVQTAAFAAGLIFAALWIRRLYGAHFWRAIHLHWVSWEWAGGMVLAGIVLSLSLGALEKVLPMPQQLPIDRIFNTRSAWALTVYGVLLAPFFEEFFFRGLIYPSLRLSFAQGMSRQQARAWRPFLWAGAAAVAVVAGLLWMRRVTASLPPGRAEAACIVAVAAGILAVPLLDGLAWIFRLLARWEHPELLAIVLTGFLFGLAHSAQLADAWLPIAIISLVGIALTTARAVSGSLLPGWILHMVYNGVLFVLLFATTSGYHDFHKLIR